MYDSRIGRRWEIDPLTYPWQSPYSTFNNNSILFADPLGLRGDDKGKKGKTKHKGDQAKFESGKKVDWKKARKVGIEKVWKGYDLNLKSAPTGNGPAGNGQPQPDPATPGAFTSEGQKIISAPKSKQELLNNHDFLAQPFFEISIFTYDVNKDELRADAAWDYRFPGGIKPSISLGCDGNVTVGSNGATTSSDSEFSLFGMLGKSNTTTQFAQINKSSQNVLIDNKTQISVATSTTIYIFIENSKTKLMNKKVNLKITKQTFFNVQGLIMFGPIENLIDSNYKKLDFSVEYGGGAIKAGAGIK